MSYNYAVKYDLVKGVYVVKLYHGTIYSSAIDIIGNGIDLNCSQKMLDFGKGFYTTPDREYAIMTAKNKTLKHNRKYKQQETPVVIEFDYASNENLHIKELHAHNDVWALFVLANRMNLTMIDKYNIIEHNLDNRYDIVHGEIADGSITQVSYQIRNNEKTPFDIDIKSLLQDGGLSYGYQFSFHTQAALSCIKAKKCDIIK